MKRVKITIKLILTVLVLVLSISCAQSPQKPTPESEDGPKPVPSLVEELENDVISIMSQVDLVPYYEKQIAEKEKKKQEKIQLEILIGKNGSQNNKDSKQEEGGGESNQGGGGNELDKLIEFKPAPITIDDILLTEVLKQEIEEKNKNSEEIPDDINMIWHEINTKIVGLHDKWNSLEPEIKKSGSSPKDVEGFNNALNSLTVSGNQNNYMTTLINGNILTYHIPDLIGNFKNKFPSAIYNMKFLVRQIVLDSSNDSYDKAIENIDKLKVYKDSLEPQLIEKKLTEPAGKLTSSVKALEDALKLEDLNIVKIKASVVMKNINSTKEELSK